MDCARLVRLRQHFRIYVKSNHRLPTNPPVWYCCGTLPAWNTSFVDPDGHTYGQRSGEWATREDRCTVQNMT